MKRMALSIEDFLRLVGNPKWEDDKGADAAKFGSKGGWPMAKLPGGATLFLDQLSDGTYQFVELTAAGDLRRRGRKLKRIDRVLANYLVFKLTMS